MVSGLLPLPGMVCSSCLLSPSRRCPHALGHQVAIPACAPVTSSNSNNLQHLGFQSLCKPTGQVWVPENYWCINTPPFSPHGGLLWDPQQHGPLVIHSHHTWGWQTFYWPPFLPCLVSPSCSWGFPASPPKINTLSSYPCFSVCF